MEGGKDRLGRERLRKKCRREFYQEPEQPGGKTCGENTDASENGL